MYRGAKDGRLVLNLGDPDDPRLTCVEVKVEHGDLTEEIMKTIEVKMRDSRRHSRHGQGEIR